MIFIANNEVNLSFNLFFFCSYADHRVLHSFPTRRSSDLSDQQGGLRAYGIAADIESMVEVLDDVDKADGVDRKSTRLNSSHGYISYAVFCLKKKNNHSETTYLYRLHTRLVIYTVIDNL